MKELGFKIELLVEAQRTLLPNAYKNCLSQIESLKLPYTEQGRILTDDVEFRCSSRIFPLATYRALQQSYATVQRDGHASTSSEDLEDSFPDSHLCTHSTEGYFLPCPIMEAPIFAPTVPGGYVGSSDKLRQELLELVPVFQIELAPLKTRGLRRGGGFDLTPESLASLQEQGLDSNSSSIPHQKNLWLTLYEASRLSQLHGSAIYLTHVEVEKKV